MLNKLPQPKLIGNISSILTRITISAFRIHGTLIPLLETSINIVIAMITSLDLITSYKVIQRLLDLKPELILSLQIQLVLLHLLFLVPITNQFQSLLSRVPELCFGWIHSLIGSGSIDS